MDLIIWAGPVRGGIQCITPGGSHYAAVISAKAFRRGLGVAIRTYASISKPREIFIRAGESTFNIIDVSGDAVTFVAGKTFEVGRDAPPKVIGHAVALELRDALGITRFEAAGGAL